MVLVLVTLLAAVVTEFTFNSRVDLQLAVNSRDELQAEYNALSALRLRAVILRQSQKIKLIVTQLMGGDAGSFPLGQILEMIPVECGLMSAIIQTSESGEGDEEGGGGDFFQGDCLATSESEHSKISLNVLDSNSKQDALQIAEYLYALLLDPKLERHFQEDDKNGGHAETPVELVGAVADWIDRDDNEFGTQVGDEGRHYAYLRDSYEAKNAPLDSVAEIQLIHGIDDEMYALLKDSLTIYPSTAQIELGTASAMTINQGILSCRIEGIFPDQVMMNPAYQAFWMAFGPLKQASSVGMGVLNVTILKTLLMEAGLGAMIDIQKVAQKFTDKSNNVWFTIHAEGHVGNASRRIKTVFQAREGRFYYARVE
jgi:general secretion pathway protein K